MTNENVAGLSKQRNKIRFRACLFRKETNSLEKMWTEQIHTRKTKTWKGTDRLTGENRDGSDLEQFLLASCYVNIQIEFPKMFCSFQFVRGAETLSHEGKVAIFGVFLPKKFKKRFSRIGALPNSNFFPLFQSPTLSSLGKIMPQSHLVALT